jgi:hypothetical protein
VQALPSSQAVEVGRGVTVQLLVPLHARVAQASSLQVMVVPVQAPAPSQWSPKVQALPSLHAVDVGLGVTVQVAVPLHARVAQLSLVQVMGVPWQPPAVH